jgi:dihydropteroate synthase
LKHFPEALLSIDTFRSEVAKPVSNGASIINDISAGNLDEGMFEVIAEYEVPYDAYRTPQTMQSMTTMMILSKKCYSIFREN